MKQPEIKSLEVWGINIPYKVHGKIHTKNQVRDREPQYMVNLRQFIASGNLSTGWTAYYKMLKDVLKGIVAETSFKRIVTDCPIAVSALIPEGFYYRDNHRVYVNEAWAEDRAVDADADRAYLIEVTREDATRCVFNKFPITTTPAILTRLDMLPVEEFSDLNTEVLSEILITGDPPNEKDLFDSNQTDPNIGLITSMWDTYELKKFEHLPIEQKLAALYTDPDRIEDIEGKIKMSRKDEGIFTKKSKIEDLDTRISDQHAWLLTRVGRLNRLRQDQLDWMTDWDTVLQALTRCLQLTPEFVPVREPVQQVQHEQTVHNTDLLWRLIECGALQYEEYPHKHDKLPPAIRLWLTNARGEAAGLIDTRRGDTLAFCAVIPPIFDPLAPITTDNGEWQGYGPKWLHPLWHLQKRLALYDNTIRGQSGEIGRWPRTVEDLSRYPVKTAQVQNIIQEWASSIGDIVPSIENNEPTKLAKTIVCHSVHVDFSKCDTVESKWETAKLAEETAGHKLSLSGTKPGNGKMLLAHPNGVSLLSDPTCHLRRASRMRSQMIRGIKADFYRVAVVQPATENHTLTGTLQQCWITPSGIEKQRATAFMAQVSNEPDEEFPMEIQHPTWTGEIRTCWTRSARETIEIGKLVDKHGNKFVPAPYPQVKDDIGEIDLLIPAVELFKKDCLAFFLANCEEKLITCGDKVTIAAVGTFGFIRTGAPSENIPVRQRLMAFRGLNGMKIKSQAAKLDSSIWAPDLWAQEDFDISFEEQLFSAANALKDRLLAAMEP